MIFITAKFPVKPEHADAWPELTREFTEATRAEPGCRYYQPTRSLEDMTHALSERMDAIESFAADVAHELKNPLTSLRSVMMAAS